MALDKPITGQTIMCLSYHSLSARLSIATQPALQDRLSDTDRLAKQSLY